jgi:hypothetical protein
MPSPETNPLTKTGWTLVRPEDAIVGRTLHRYQPRQTVPVLDKQGQPVPGWSSNELLGLYVDATIIEIGAHRSDQSHGQSGDHVRVQFEVPEQYAGMEFV